MTEEEKKLLNTFEARVRHFIYLHEEMRREASEMKKLLKQKEKEINELQKSYKTLQENYTNLKIAKALSGESADLKSTKLRLTNIVREVDKCIALLNE
jgi:hypothetical protein